GDRLSSLGVAGIVVTIAGAMLTSTDLRALASGLPRAPGLPWAAASAVLFGFAAYVFGWSAQRAGWLPTLWVSRTSTTAVLVAAALIVRTRTAGERGRPAGERGRLAGERGRLAGVRILRLAIVVGAVDLLGAVMYARGAE